MKLSASFAVVSFLAAQIVLTVARPLHDAEGYKPRGSLRARQNNRFGNNQNGGNRFGGQNGGNRFGGNRGGNTTAKTTTTAAAAKTTTTAAAKTTTTAAAAKTTTTAAAAANGGKKVTTTTAAAAKTTTAAANTAAAGNNGNNNNSGGNLQTSLQLDPSQIGPNLALTGQENVSEAGQVPSLTSKNNYINFCATTGQAITNGLQQVGGSCNPVPMGQIPAKANVPTCKFVFPKNGATIPANKDFTIQLAIQGLITGNFVNPNTNYYSAPQQLKNGVIVGHSHVTVQKLNALDQTTPADPNVFAFFKGLNTAASNGVLSATVTGGLPAGVYRVSSINTAANHQPAVGPVAQRGAFEDAVYFTVQ